MQSNYIHPLQQSTFAKPIPKKPATKHETHFTDILANVTKLKVSKHAQTRLHERGIHISEQDWAKVSKKMNEAKIKGVTDALVIMDEVALVVSTKNHTVVTALHHKEAESKIFTNINGTIFL